MYADRQRHSVDPDRGRGLPRPVVQSPENAGSQQAARLGGGLSPATALSLQRAIGNAAVARLAERERHQHTADCGHGTSVQRSTDDQTVQRDALDRVDAVTRTSGSPLRTDVRRRMESDYGGEDFSDVRVHVDRSSAEAVGAKAYTTKTHHIVFRSAADMDDHTMRHELQHVRQQRAGGVPSGISDPTDAWERDAESAATRLKQRPMDVQRSTNREQNHTPTPGVTVQRMPRNRSRREEGRGRSRSECRIEGLGSGARLRVSRSFSPAHSSRDEAEPTTRTWNFYGGIRNRGGLAFIGSHFNVDNDNLAENQERVPPQFSAENSNFHGEIVNMGVMFMGSNFSVGSGEINGRTFHMSPGLGESVRGSTVLPRRAPREEFIGERRAPSSTIVNFDGDLTVQGNAALFLRNFVNAGHYSAWSQQQGGRRGEQATDYAAGEVLPDYTREDLYIGNVFNIQGGTVTLSGGVYVGNDFIAERIIIRGNAMFVGGNSFSGEVEVDNPDQVAQEFRLGEITDAHADRVTPL